MFIPDMPNVPAQTPVVMIAQAGQAQDVTKKKERILGICGVVDGDSDIVEIDPGMDATHYLWRYDKNTNASFDDATITIVQQPKHGILSNGQWNSDSKQFASLPEGTSQFEQNLYKYMPEPGYEGKDFAVIRAEKDGVKVTIYYFLHATIAINANYLCERPEGVWKISSTTPALDNAGLQTLLGGANINEHGVRSCLLPKTKIPADELTPNRQQ